MPTNQSAKAEAATAQRCVTIAKWTLAVAVLSSLLFAHGCHGDEDHELLDDFVVWATRD